MVSLKAILKKNLKLLVDDKMLLTGVTTNQIADALAIELPMDFASEEPDLLRASLKLIAASMLLNAKKRVVAPQFDLSLLVRGATALLKGLISYLFSPEDSRTTMQQVARCDISQVLQGIYHAALHIRLLTSQGDAGKMTCPSLAELVVGLVHSLPTFPSLHG